MQIYDWAVLPLPCFAADIDNDGSVGPADLLIVLAQWGPCPPQCFGDVDGDGFVDFGDVMTVLRTWGSCPG